MSLDTPEEPLVPATVPFGLTRRELEVLAYVADGRTNAVAHRLGLLRKPGPRAL
jgi:DNA-binding CsgD family transcriptional regulator